MTAAEARASTVCSKAVAERAGRVRHEARKWGEAAPRARVVAQSRDGDVKE